MDPETLKTYDTDADRYAAQHPAIEQARIWQLVERSNERPHIVFDTSTESRQS